MGLWMGVSSSNTAGALPAVHRVLPLGPLVRLHSVIAIIIINNNNGNIIPHTNSHNIQLAAGIRSQSDRIFVIELLFFKSSIIWLIFLDVILHFIIIKRASGLARGANNSVLCSISREAMRRRIGQWWNNYLIRDQWDVAAALGII